MDHRNFLQTSKKLLNDSCTEADIRSAVSRAYYAAHLHVRFWWDSLSGLPKRLKGESLKGRAHTLIPRALRNSGVSDAVDVGIDLDALCINRTLADYTMSSKKVKGVFTHKSGYLMLKKARNLILRFDKIDKASWEQSVISYLQRSREI